MPPREMTIAGQRLTKHAGDGYHFYRGKIEGLVVTVRPLLSQGRRRVPIAWNAYANVEVGKLHGETGPACIAHSETLTDTVAGAVRLLKFRAAARRRGRATS